MLLIKGFHKFFQILVYNHYSEDPDTKLQPRRTFLYTIVRSQ